MPSWEKNSKRAGYMEDHQLRLAHGKAAPRRAGVLEDELRSAAPTGDEDKDKDKENTKH